MRSRNGTKSAKTDLEKRVKNQRYLTLVFCVSFFMSFVKISFGRLAEVDEFS